MVWSHDIVRQVPGTESELSVSLKVEIHANRNNNGQAIEAREICPDSIALLLQ